MTTHYVFVYWYDEDVKNMILQAMSQFCRHKKAEIIRKRDERRDFIYLSRWYSQCDKHVKDRVGKAMPQLCGLRRLYNSSDFTKIMLFYSLVLYVLLYSCKN